MARNTTDGTTNPFFFCALAAIVMAYGWGYRGITGHEGGAMVPGAMLGLAACVAAARPDWHRRAAVAGLFGAVGWAWGGALSYMEQTFYTVSDSFPDVLYGYTMLFFLGGLWAGTGGAILGLAFTLPRSRLDRLALPFAVISAIFLLIYLYFLAFPEQARAFIGTGEALFPVAGEWLSATVVLLVGLVYAALRRQERAEALLFVCCALAWWTGYLLLVWLAGLGIGPPFRSESWAGGLGVLLVLLLYLWRDRNRAALMLSLYGLLGGGIAFALAVFVRHPVRVEWGPFAAWHGTMQWKIAEECFGLFMGFAIALGVLRFARGRLAPPEEDTPPLPLDLFAAFVILVGIMWINLRRAPERWVERYHIFSDAPVGPLTPWTWFTIGGLTLSLVAIYGLYLYARGRLFLLPEKPYAKAVLLLITLLWIVAVGSFVQQLPPGEKDQFPLVDATFMAFAAMATLMVLSRADLLHAPELPRTESVDRSDLRWRVGRGYLLLCLCVPMLLLAETGLSMAMQPGPADNARLRFGPEAYWREALRVVGAWHTLGFAEEADGPAIESAQVPFTNIRFNRDRTADITLQDGSAIERLHGWHHADSVIWLDWYAGETDNPENESVGMQLQSGKLYIPWPPAGPSARFLVLERTE